VCIWFSFFFSSRRRHTRSKRDWSSDVCSSDLMLNFDIRNRRLAMAAPVGDIRTAVNQPFFIQLDKCLPHGCRAALVQRKTLMIRSEERRVGKEGGCRWARATERRVMTALMRCG